MLTEVILVLHIYTLLLLISAESNEVVIVDGTNNPAASDDTETEEGGFTSWPQENADERRRQRQQQINAHANNSRDDRHIEAQRVARDANRQRVSSAPEMDEEEESKYKTD